jgi:hypothetical protein
MNDDMVWIAAKLGPVRYGRPTSRKINDSLFLPGEYTFLPNATLSAGQVGQR